MRCAAKPLFPKSHLIQQDVIPMPNEQKYLYILFSATPYRMGSLIRRVTGEPYNHVAIATEKELREMYAFARRYYRTPFYGGFVTERPCRYHHNGTTATVRLCRLPLTTRQWDTLNALLDKMRDRADRYLYNHLSAMMAPLHRKIRVRDAFTCAEFAVNVLHTLGFDFDPETFYTIGDIAQRLESYQIYTGDFPAAPEADPTFFHPHPLPHPVASTTKNLLRLLWRRARA